MAVFIALIAILGLMVGSYLGVVADRLPRDEPTSTGRSHCDACGADLRWFELIPVVSWVLQGGRCRRCRASITLTPLLMELATGALFGGVAARFGADIQTAAFLVLVAVLVPLSLIDLRVHRLPRQLIYVGGAVGAPLLVVAAIVADEPQRIWWAAVGAAGALAFFLALYLGWSGGMGDGDVRLAALLGMNLGWIGLMHVPVGLFLGFLAGAVVGVVAMARGGGRKTAVPFGPFMALGAMAVVFWGHPLIRLWLGD
jgi:leader peptidase (prepilin peptidase)/N-methyltransferase